MSASLTSNSLTALTILITGASSGIGATVAHHCAAAHAHALILFARSQQNLDAVSASIAKSHPDSKTLILTFSVDVRDVKAVRGAVQKALDHESIAERGIDVLVNNAGLAVGAPARFPDLALENVDLMVDTNLKGMLYVTHAVLNLGGTNGKGMLARGTGVILNVTSVTALEVPPFPGECIYHTTKAAQEAFTNSLRVELQGTNIQVVVVRPGVVADTTFHKQRVGGRKEDYDGFMSGFEPLVSEDVAEQVVWVLAGAARKGRVMVKALDVVPSAQRMLYVIDKEWNERNGVADTKME